MSHNFLPEYRSFNCFDGRIQDTGNYIPERNSLEMHIPSSGSMSLFTSHDISSADVMTNPSMRKLHGATAMSNSRFAFNKNNGDSQRVSFDQHNFMTGMPAHQPPINMIQHTSSLEQPLRISSSIYPVTASQVHGRHRNIQQEHLFKAAALSNRFTNWPIGKGEYFGTSRLFKSQSNQLSTSQSHEVDINGTQTSHLNTLTCHPAFPRPLTENTVSVTFDNHGVDYSPVSESASACIPLCNYYSTLSLESHCKMQLAPQLTPPWIMAPPVPEGVGDFLRTGRVNDIRSKVTSERIPAASYMDQALRQVLHNKLKASLLTDGEVTNSKFPSTIGAYTALTLMENLIEPKVSTTFKLPTQCFKAWSPRLLSHLLLRRIILPEEAQDLPTSAYVAAQQICDLEHPNIVRLRDVFPTDQFDDKSLIFAYDFCPCSSTLQQAYMSDPLKLTRMNSQFNAGRTSRPHDATKESFDVDILPEKLAWNFLVQLTISLRFIHQSNRACCVLDPTKILVQDGSKLLVNCFGLRDIVDHNVSQSTTQKDQLADFISLGRLILSVVCGTSMAIQSSQQSCSLSLVSRTYSNELVSLIRNLLTGQVTSVDHLVRITAPFAFDHMSSLYSTNDYLERQIFREMECGRLFRLLCKLVSVVERFDLKRLDKASPEWSETGDRYMLKLFRDFVFHQVDQLGAPYLDLSHIVNTLNKVEAASAERLCLVSRDGLNVIIVTYAEVRQYLDNSFATLVEEHRRSLCEQQLTQQRLQEDVTIDTSQPSGNIQ